MMSRIWLETCRGIWKYIINKCIRLETRNQILLQCRSTTHKKTVYSCILLDNYWRSLPHSQEPATSPCPEPDRSSSCSRIPLPEYSSEYYHPIDAWVFHLVSFPQISSSKPCIHIFLLHTCYMPRQFHSSRLSHDIYWGRSIDHCATQYVFSPFSCYLVPLRPKYSPQHPILKQTAAYVPPSMWATKFHTHTK